MELKTITKTIDDLKFYINQFPARKSIRLEKKTITFISPMLGMLDDFKSLDKEVDLSKIANSIQKTLSEIDDTEFENYLTEMVEYTSVELKNENDKSVVTLPLSDMKNFDAAFIGRNLTVYKLLVEIMKENKFGFFELVGGKGLNLTGLFKATK